ncbi:MAG TPA: TIGR04255 family protein [Candidatus Acidoferrales bacterium]|nr:TIGR04255 family protein [Candidatus Acidoferrales bacterium]
MSARTLPDYTNPPAVETVLGVRFSPIEGWTLLHYGLLSSKVKGEYPKSELRPPIGEVTIQISAESNFANVPVRCWFINADDTQLIQVQNNCFIRNWRKTEKTPNYLHYDVIRPLFERDWTEFLQFLLEQHLAPPSVWQCEVTYINQFVRGRDWQDFNDLGGLYPAWNGMRPEGLFSRAEMVSFAVSYSLPDGRGSLQLVSQPGIRRSDGKEIIQLTITALGKPSSSQTLDLLEWLDLGRSAVVRGFAGFTDKGVQEKKWGLRE